MKKWYTLIAVLLFLLLSSVGSVSADESNEKTIRVATYNMHTGIGTDGNYHLERIANTIRESGADIIGLQEVDVHWSSRSDFENQIQILADTLDMDYFFAPIYNFDPLASGEPRRQYGVAVLSKYPILHAENREIARLSTQDANPVPTPAPGFLEAQIHVKGEEVWFYVTHLDYRSDPTVREMQVSDMLDIMPAHPNNILVGDMNATPESPELAPLFQQFEDTWDLTNEEPGYTFPAEAPDRRIDYVLTATGMDVQSASVIPSMASDHLPVTADIILEPGSNPFDASSLADLVAYFEEEGELADVEAARALKIHLASVSHYEDIGSGERVVKHMDGFKRLLDYQRENALLSEQAYETLKIDADYLIGKWR
ncbi:endonuclease/exonuclease/phosphatase family protein [Lentibacillus sediminis]|uniref:endonuclease/exonuclease/phosphatase family protein n=1 Tax=Lentibacillus sediminis TaxID=1940529 RepID=UPI000C1BCBD5|nr:endonuclease/exonuclease/phosphatase family protein [Lentibacillus sediminis]